MKYKSRKSGKKKTTPNKPDPRVNYDSTLKVVHVLILDRYLTKFLWLFKTLCKISKRCRLNILNIFVLLYAFEYLFSET